MSQLSIAEQRAVQLSKSKSEQMISQLQPAMRRFGEQGLPKWHSISTQYIGCTTPVEKAHSQPTDVYEPPDIEPGTSEYIHKNYVPTRLYINI
jgi:hypothetical protein